MVRLTDAQRAKRHRERKAGKPVPPLKLGRKPGGLTLKSLADELATTKAELLQRAKDFEAEQDRKFAEIRNLLASKNFTAPPPGKPNEPPFPVNPAMQRLLDQHPKPQLPRVEVPWPSPNEPTSAKVRSSEWSEGA